MAFLFLLSIYKENNDMSLNNRNKLQGSDAIKRAKELMSLSESVAPARDTKGFQIVKKGNDHNAYAIVKEASKYFLMKAPLTESLHYSDFKYINGEANKTNFMYTSYHQALKALGSKLITVNESFGGFNSSELYSNDIDVDFTPRTEVQDVPELGRFEFPMRKEISEDELDFEIEDENEIEFEFDNSEIFGEENAFDDYEEDMFSVLNELDDILSEGLKKKF